MTLQEVEAGLTALADAPGLWVNTKLALAGNVAVDGEEVVVTDVRGREVRLAPEDISTLRHASADECGEAGRALARVR